MTRSGRCTLLLLGLAVASPASGVELLDRVVLQNEVQRIVLARGKLRASDPTAVAGMRWIESREGPDPVRFDTRFSPLFQIELRSHDPARAPLRVPSGTIDLVFLPEDRVRLEEPGPGAACLSWAAIPVPGTSQTLDVDLLVNLPAPDGAARWDLSARISDGSYFIYAARFPYLALGEIGGDGADDRFLIPFTGGQVLPDPIESGNPFPERTVPEGGSTDAFFTYPGSILSQFMAYYDEEAAGLYLATEDPDGTIKNFYFGSAPVTLRPQRRRLYLYVTHFNAADSPGPGAPTVGVLDELRSFSLASGLGYPVVTDLFRGDWVDATARYRSWVEETRPPFVSRGPLRSRTDLGEAQKTTSYSLRWTLPPAPDAIDPLAEYLKIQKQLAFYDAVRLRYDPEGTIDFQPFILLMGYSLGPDGPVYVSHDDVTYPLRPGVPELVHLLRFPLGNLVRVRAVACNRDTRGMPVDGTNAAEAVVRGFMRGVDGSLTHAKPTMFRTCTGSSWLRGHRASLVLQDIASSMVNGQAGFNAAATTGTGNFAFPCHAPLVDDPLRVDRTHHNHTVGGGSFLRDGWTSLAGELKDRAAALGVSDLLLGMEHTPETMIQDYILSGRSFAPPYDDTLRGVYRTLPGARPVPVFTHLYHDYNIHPSKPPSVEVAVELYVDESHPLEDLLHLRLRQAQLAMHGRLLRANFSQADPDALDLVGPDRNPALQDEEELFAALSTLRGSLPEYLTFGQARRAPRILPVRPRDSVSMRFVLRGEETIQSIPRVVASAWSGEESTGIALVNFTPEAARVHLAFDPADLELDPAGAYRIQQRISLRTWIDTGWAFDPGQPFTSPRIEVDPVENILAAPWKIYRIIPAP